MMNYPFNWVAPEVLNQSTCDLEWMSHPPPVTQAQGGVSSCSTVLCCGSMGYVATELLGTEAFISSRSTLLHGVGTEDTWSPSGTLGGAVGSCSGAERSDTSAEIKLSLVILGTRGFGMSVSSQPRTDPWEGAVTSPPNTPASLGKTQSHQSTAPSAGRT